MNMSASHDTLWDDLRWLIVLNGPADRWVWPFAADGWRLCHGSPANGMLGILPMQPGGAVATLDDALWLADAIAFDHDAPVGISPAVSGTWENAVPKDLAGVPSVQPIHPIGDGLSLSYWQALNESYAGASDLRFNGSYVLRYGEEEDPPDPLIGADFTQRFAGREERVSLYAMAARQVDLLMEYLCLYRVLESADGSNGKKFIGSTLHRIERYDFGVLRVVGFDMKYTTAPNAFEVYKERALREMASLSAQHVDVATHLYRLRNSLAHGKHDVLVSDRGSRFEQAARALPIVKLLARIAVEDA